MTPDGQKTLYGDIRYDLAKLSHSILGLYDWIIAGYYHVEIADNAIELKIAEQSHHKETQQGFIELIEQTSVSRRKISTRCKFNYSSPCCLCMPMIVAAKMPYLRMHFVSIKFY